MSDTGGQSLPFVRLEKGKLGGHIGWYVGTAEMEICYDRCKRIDICREHVRLARERVREAAFSRLHLTYQTDPASQTVEQAKRIIDESAATEGLPRLELPSAGDQI